VVHAIVDGTAAGADDLDPVGLLDLLSDVKSIARLPAETGQIGDDQVVDIPVIFLDESVQFYEVRPVEIGRTESLIDEAIDGLDLDMLHPGTGDHVLAFDAEMALFFGTEPEIFYSFLIHMDAFDLSSGSICNKVAVTTISTIKLISKMVFRSS
jgi:hypothetical protein